MAHTNSTTNYSLPQFIPADKPAWLTDINGAFSDIDTAVYTAQTKADSAYNDAGTAQADATTAITNAAAADAKGAGAVASIEAAFDATAVYSVGAKVMYNNLLYRCTADVITPGPWTGSANWDRITVDSIIPGTAGELPLGSDFSDPTSTAGAINELSQRTTPSYLSTIAPGTNISFESNASYRVGNMVFLNCILKVTGNLANNTAILTNIPKNGANAPIRFLRVIGSDSFDGHDDNAGGLNIDANSNRITMFGTLTASVGSPKYIFINLAYICSLA